MTSGGKPVMSGVSGGRRTSSFPQPFPDEATQVTAARVLATIVAMTTLPVGDARDRFSALVASVEQTHDRVTVTRNGVPAAVLISSADLDELEETIAVLSSPDLLRQLAESAADRDRGDILDADDDRDALRDAVRSRTDR
jgi:antitoxin YefM